MLSIGALRKHNVRQHGQRGTSVFNTMPHIKVIRFKTIRDRFHLCAARMLMMAVQVDIGPFLGEVSAAASGEASKGESSTATVCAWSLLESDSTADIMFLIFVTTCALPPARSDASPIAPQEFTSS